MWSFSCNAAYLCPPVGVARRRSCIWSHPSVRPRAHSAYSQHSCLHTPHPHLPLPQSLSFLLLTLTYSCHLSLDMPMIVHLPRRWVRCQALFQPLSSSEIIHRVYAQVRPFFPMQSGQLESFRTRGLCKELAAQTTILLPLICSLSFVCPGLLIIVIIVTAFAMLTFLLLTFPRWDFVFAPMRLTNHRCCRSQNLHYRSTHNCSLPAYRHAYMHDRKRNCEIGGVRLRTYVSEFTAGDIRVVTGTKYLSITT